MPIWSLDDADPQVRAAVDAIAGVRYIHSADLSPDGKQVAYCLSTTQGEQEDVTLFVANLATGAHIEAVQGGRNHSPCWSSDGSKIAFLNDADTGTELAILDVATRTFAIVTTQPQGITEAVRWSPDGRQIVYVSPPPARDVTRPYRVTRATVFGDGLGLIDDATTDIYLFDVASGESRRLTNDSFINTQPVWDPGADAILYLSVHDPDTWSDKTTLCRVTLDGISSVLYDADDISAFAPTDDGVAVVRAGIRAYKEGQSRQKRLRRGLA